jgi:hypothetical protein
MLTITPMTNGHGPTTVELKCIVCGCTNDVACVQVDSEGRPQGRRCVWVWKDPQRGWGICSSCTPNEPPP